MSLRTVAESDLSFILEDGVYGFGWPITLIDTLDVAVAYTGFSNDIALAIDPDTGQLVSGRNASVALRLSSIAEAGQSIPQGIANANSKPWRVIFDDINGNSYTFKVQQSNPDRALGIVTCLLENYVNS
jgi:hypothetical protein